MTITDLPKHKGMPVPYVALWDQEAPTLDYLIRIGPAIGLNPLTGQPELRFLGAPDVDTSCRDDHGVLWTPERDDLGAGEARLSQLHGQRQRHSILEGHCQVCDTKLDPATFLLPRAWMPLSQVHTMTAPLCHNCAPYALRYCPHLRNEGPWAWATVERVTHSGYLGDLTILNDDGSFSQEKGATIAINDPRTKLLLAKQAVARLSGIIWEA